MELAELIRDLDLVAPAGIDARVADITEDSRTVMPGSLFVARQGLKVDGRRFIADAVGAGASVVLTDREGAAGARDAGCVVLVSDDVAVAAAHLAERFYGEPARALRTVGVTGTNGKTTVVHLVHQMLNAAGERTGLIGTVEIDDGSEVAASDMTTMPAIELSRTLAVMRESGCVAAAMEVSSHALDQGRVAAVPFDVGVFTNLTRDHLDYHGTMEAYASAKARLFESLDGGSTAVVNVDDAASARMVRDCGAEVMTCSSQKGGGGAECSVRAVEALVDGTVYELLGPWGELVARVPLLGGHNGMNLLQAAAVAWAMGLDASAIGRAMHAVVPPRGRMEFVTPQGAAVSVVVDFAHTPDALEKALVALRPAAVGRLWVVFGAGGDKDREKRPMMGEVAARLADRVVVTSDNPRTEDPSAIIGDVVRGMPAERRGAMNVHVDRGRAIEHAIGAAEAGDVVLIAGRGHEAVQVVGDGRGGTREVVFDDATVAREALKLRGGLPSAGSLR